MAKRGRPRKKAMKKDTDMKPMMEEKMMMSKNEMDGMMQKSMPMKPMMGKRHGKYEG